MLQLLSCRRGTQLLNTGNKMLTSAKHVKYLCSITTDAIYEERGSDWSHHVSAVATIWLLQCDQTPPLSAKGVAYETGLHEAAPNRHCRSYAIDISTLHKNRIVDRNADTTSPFEWQKRDNGLGSKIQGSSLWAPFTRPQEVVYMTISTQLCKVSTGTNLHWSE